MKKVLISVLVATGWYVHPDTISSPLVPQHVALLPTAHCTTSV